MMINFISGIGIDFLCLSSKAAWIPVIMLTDLVHGLNLTNMIEIACFLSIFLSVLLQVIIDFYAKIKEFIKENLSVQAEEKDGI
jgi:hypothetical protein